MKILIASENGQKVNGVRQAFEIFYGNDIDVQGVTIPSGVSDEPIRDEVYLGAKNRINGLIEYAKENFIEADFFASIESGLIEIDKHWINISYAIIEDKNGMRSVATSPGYPIPDKYVEEVINSDLKQLFEKISTKEHSGISFLTHGEFNRKDLMRTGFIMALTQFVNGDLWTD